MTDTDADSFLAVNLMGYTRNLPFTGWWIGNLCIGSWHPTQNITQALGDGGPDTGVGKMLKLGWDFNLESVTFDKKYTAHFFVQGKYDLEKSAEVTANTPAAPDGKEEARDDGP